MNTAKKNEAVTPLSRRRVFDIIQIGNVGDIPSRAFDVLSIIMILSNLLIAILETFAIPDTLTEVLTVIETVTVVWFTMEYVLRLWTSDYLYAGKQRAKCAFRYAKSFNGIVDLLSFLPFYLPVFFPAGVVAFRMFRVIRILRLFRINAYSDALTVISDVVKSKKDQLLSSIFIILVLMVAASLCMYSLEHDAQPEVFQNAFSGFWWAVSSLLTVGYGDIYPITTAGRIFGICITFLGVLMVAIPTGILSAGFVEVYTRQKSLNEFAEEENLRFIRLDITEDHPWAHSDPKELLLPPGLVLAVIQREGEIESPEELDELLPGDRLLLAGAGGKEELGITLKEVRLDEDHPWTGLEIRQLDISRRTLVVTVRRGKEVLVPKGKLVLLAGDVVLLYTRSVLPDAKDVTI